MTATQLPLILSPRASRAVDGALVRVRLVLALGAWLIITLSTGSYTLNQVMTAWLGLLLIFNLLVLLILRNKTLPRSLPRWGLIGDLVFFGSLPYIAPTNSSILFLFGVFPTIVGALRYGPYAGTAVAFVLAIPFGARSLAGYLPPPGRDLLPLTLPAGDVNLLAAGLPVLALFAVVILVGYLAQREREAVVGDTAVELAQLRHAMAGAKLLYETADTLNQTLSYSLVLDAMLEAGTSGMPLARREDGPALGLVMLFESNAVEKFLKVVAWRNLDRADIHAQLPGREGIIAQALETGEPFMIPRMDQDPELRTLTTFRRVRAGICLPLQAGLDLYGVVVLATPAPRIPSDQHMNLMRAFTNQAAVAFQNARLYQSLREERDHIIDAEANARAKLARDLHDGPTQTLASLAMRLDYIVMLMDKEPGKAREELELARDSAIRTGKELRELLFTLRPLTLETQGLSATLRLWAQRLKDNEGFTFDLDAGNFRTEIDPKIGGTVFAVIEEAVNNARKHGHGAPIHVRVCKQDGNLVATIQDEGPGFDVAAVEMGYDQRGSLGLVNMRERARLLDGRLSIDSAPGRGTRVLFTAPLGGQNS